SLAAIALQTIFARHYGAAFAEVELAVFEFMIGLGLLTALLAVFPSRNGGGARFDRAADLSRLSLDIRVSRPALLRGGLGSVGIGLVGTGLLQLFAGIL